MSDEDETGLDDGDRTSDRNDGRGNNPGVNLPDPVGSNEADDVVDLRPSVESLNQFKAAGYKEWWALAEFVDNSISSYEVNQARLREHHGTDYKLNVEITVDEVRNVIIISDNAAGIAASDMQRAFTSGTPPLAKNRVSLSRFGLGMKAAGVWFGDRIEVETHALDEDRVKMVAIDLEEINRTGTPTVRPTYFPGGRRPIGTTVTLSKLTKQIPVTWRPGGTLPVIEEYLSSIYRGYLRSNAINISIRTIRSEQSAEAHDVRHLTFPQVEFLSAPVWSDPDGPAVDWLKSFEFEISIGGISGVIRGTACLRAEGSYQNTGLVLVWRGKVIKGASAGRDVREGSDPPYKPHKLFKATNSAISLRLLAEVDVSVFETTTRKDDLTWTTGEEDKFIELLVESLDSDPLKLIDQAKNYRKVEKSRSVIQQWTDVIEQAGPSIDGVASELAVENFEQLIETRSAEDVALDAISIEDVMEYTYPLNNAGDKIAVRIGFASLENVNRTYILQEFPDDPHQSVLVAINRASKFAVNFLNPQLINPTPFVRVIASLALAELYLARKAGLPRAGAMRRLFNLILDSDAMTTKPEGI